MLAKVGDDPVGTIQLHQPSSSSLITATQRCTRSEPGPDKREWGKKRAAWDRRAPPLFTSAGSCVEAAFPIENRDNLGRVLQTPYQNTKHEWRDLDSRLPRSSSAMEAARPYMLVHGAIPYTDGAAVESPKDEPREEERSAATTGVEH